MKFPLGDLVRALAKPGSWLARIFKHTKGISVKVNDYEIALDEEHSMGGTPSDLDRPHRPGGRR